MAKHDIQERLINGFSRHGYELYAEDYLGMNNEFRKPDTALRFIAKPGEGFFSLLWTESPEHDLMTPTMYDLSGNLPPDVQRRSFSGDPSAFWACVESIVNPTR